MNPSLLIDCMWLDEHEGSVSFATSLPSGNRIGVLSALSSALAPYPAVSLSSVVVITKFKH